MQSILKEAHWKHTFIIYLSYISDLKATFPQKKGFRIGFSVDKQNNKILSLLLKIFNYSIKNIEKKSDCPKLIT